MKQSMKAALAAGAAILAASQVAPAQDLNLGAIVVTPSRTPLEKRKVGSTVEKVERERIEQESKPFLNDYLANLPGIAIGSPGGVGQEGSLSIRGAPRRYVKTLFNGIDIGDPTAPNVQTSYQYLLASNLDSIEVLKGSQGTLYGSDAIAGVIGLSTLGDIPLGVSHLFHAEGGSRTTIRGGYGLRAASERAKVSINLNGFYTDGISAADENDGNTEHDAFANGTFDAAGEIALSDTFSIFGSLLYIDSVAEFDDSFPIADNPDAKNYNTQLAGRLGFNLDLADGRFRNTFSVQAFDIDREIRGTFFDGDYDGTRWKAEYQGSFDATDWLTLLVGADYEHTGIAVPGISGPHSADFSLGGVWFEGLVSPVENLTVTLGARQAWHSAFGGDTTWRASASYEFPASSTRLHSSLGTGFRAPSLDELYGPFGSNPDLGPERSLSFDVGVEQRLGDRFTADITYFLTNIEDLIAYVGAGYTQIPGTARMRGIEASLSFAATSWLDLGGVYTYTRAVNQNDVRLQQVPAHVVGLSVAARPWEKWTISADARISLDTVDGGTPLDDYVLVNAKVAYKPTEATELYVRAENLLNQQYQTVRGYGTPDFSVFAGFRARIGP